MNGKLDTVSGQVQSLNDSVDELKSRIAKLDKSIQDLQTQLQNIQNPPPAGRCSRLRLRQRTAKLRRPLPASAIPVPRIRRRRSGDLSGRSARLQRGKVRGRAGEFQDVLHYYPLDDLAGHGAVLPRRDRLPAEQTTRRREGLQRRARGLHRQRQGSGSATAQRHGFAADEHARTRGFTSCARSSSATRKPPRRPRHAPS